jgi:DHA1 family bicyclomycin/chloramphenicol resistance-like MFS transporter
MDDMPPLVEPGRAEPVPILHRRAFVLVLGALSMMAPLSTDMYLPATPGISRALAASEATVIATLSAFFLGFGIGQLVWGPLGDRFGRRRPMVVGLALNIVASLACATAASGEALVGWRFIAGLGGCAPVVLAQAMIRDSFDRREGAGMLSAMMLVGNLAPLLAPTFGGAVLGWFGWRAIFLALALFGLASMAGLLLLPETFPAERRPESRRRDMVLGYLSLLRDRRYLGYMLTMGCFGGGFFAWLASSPFIFIQYYGIPPKFFGLVFAGGVLTLMAGNLANRKLIRHFDPDQVLRAGLLLAALAGVAAAVVALQPVGRLWILAPLLWSFVGAQSLIIGNATAGALAKFPHRAGTAAALLGAARSGCGAAGGTLVGWLADGTPWPVTAVIGGLALAGLAIHLLLVRDHARHG